MCTSILHRPPSHPNTHTPTCAHDLTPPAVPWTPLLVHVLEAALQLRHQLVKAAVCDVREAYEVLAEVLELVAGDEPHLLVLITQRAQLHLSPLMKLQAGRAGQGRGQHHGQWQQDTAQAETVAAHCRGSTTSADTKALSKRKPRGHMVACKCTWLLVNASKWMLCLDAMPLVAQGLQPKQ